MRGWKQTIRRWVQNREIPFCKIKSVVRFRVSEIEKWIDGDGKALTAKEKREVRNRTRGSEKKSCPVSHRAVLDCKWSLKKTVVR
jgi:excisionase family DNA binding protein